MQAITLAAGVFRLDRKYRREHRISVRRRLELGNKSFYPSEHGFLVTGVD